jgi:hypothetical protein
MSAQALRRWLQPSPVLRWHPWAPIGALVAILLVTFILGMKLGHAAGSRRDVAYEKAVQAGTMKMALEGFEQYPAKIRVVQAQMMDDAVLAWAKAPGRTDVYPGLVRDIGEYRVTQLAGDSPLWKATSSFCAEAKNPSGYDLVARWEPAAKAYTKLLGREIRAEQLAPAVPGGRC